MNNSYTATIDYATKELTPKEKVKVKNTTNTLKLDSCVQEDEQLTIALDYAVKIHIKNEKNKNGEKEYNAYVFVDKETGIKYSTSSDSLWNSFIEIFEEMTETNEDWQLIILKKPSKNYAGKFFLTCDIV